MASGSPKSSEPWRSPRVRGRRHRPGGLSEAAAGSDEVGPVDVLVNNAGVISGQLLSELTDEAIERTLAVNTLALFWCTRAFLPAMVERRRGHVVTLASAAGLVGVVRQTDYSASKHAAVGFAESLRFELRRYAPEVHTTLVCPFYINTGMFDGAGRGCRGCCRSWTRPRSSPRSSRRWSATAGSC